MKEIKNEKIIPSIINKQPGKINYYNYFKYKHKFKHKYFNKTVCCRFVVLYIFIDNPFF